MPALSAGAGGGNSGGDGVALTGDGRDAPFCEHRADVVQSVGVFTPRLDNQPVCIVRYLCRHVKKCGEKEMKNRNFSGTAKEARKYSPTEILILTFIARGHATTLYALQKETLISAGALVPALARLKAEGLISLDPVGLRKRQQFRINSVIFKKARGYKETAIEENLKASAQEHIADCDAVLKLCKAAEILDLSYAVEYAHSAAELRASELRKYTSQEGRVEAPEVDPFSYRSYLDVARFYQLQAEEHTLRAVEAALMTDMLREIGSVGIGVAPTSQCSKRDGK